MAFVAEDGTGVQNANSLVTLAFADEYHEDRDNGDWLKATQRVKQAKLIEATEYFVGKFTARLPGARKTDTQSFHFPATKAKYRDGRAIADDVIPVEVLKAVSELALAAVSNPLQINHSPSAPRFAERERTRTLGPLTTKTVYDTSVQSVNNASPSYPLALQFLRNLLLGSGRGVIRN